MKTRPLVFALVSAGLLISPGWSQQNANEAGEPAPVVEPAAPAEPDIVIHGAEPTENVATKGRSDAGADTLSVDFPDEDVRNILRNVADLFELNLVIPDTLQGRTSIKLRDVTWRQIFDVVLAPVGFTYIEDGNIIKVVSNESLQAEPVTTEVFVLNYANAADLVPTLTPLIDGAVGGSIVVNSRSNALVITERPSRFSRIRPIIDQLDKATEQVMIETKFVEVTDQDVKNIGVNWSSLAAMQVGAGNINQTWERGRGQTRDGTRTGRVESNDDTTYVTTPATINPANGGFADSTLNLPDGSVSNLPSSVPGRTGVANFDVDPDTGAISYTAPTTHTGSNALTDLASLTNGGSTARLASAVFSASDFNIIISALKTQNDTKLVSNPTVVTLNNTEATINIGREYPIPNYTYNQERGTYEVSGFEYRPIGIILRVTPQVNATGFIKLAVEPEVSSSNESAPFGATEIPIITTRKTKTQVSLKDGYTMGIGGLIENSNTVGQTKVPVLGSIPLLGRLFRSDSKDLRTRNLIIFITAKTVSADGAPIEDVFDSRRVRQLNMTRDELPGYRDGSDPFVQPLPADGKKKKK